MKEINIKNNLIYILEFTIMARDARDSEKVKINFPYQVYGNRLVDCYDLFDSWIGSTMDMREFSSSCSKAGAILNDISRSLYNLGYCDFKYIEVIPSSTYYSNIRVQYNSTEEGVEDKHSVFTDYVLPKYNNTFEPDDIRHKAYDFMYDQMTYVKKKISDMDITDDQLDDVMQLLDDDDEDDDE